MSRVVFSRTIANRILRAVELSERKPSTMKTGAGIDASSTRFGIIVSSGPNSEPDFSGAQYWVRAARLANTDNDDSSILVFEELAEDDPRFDIYAATNLVELFEDTHGVPHGSVVVLMFCQSPSSPGIKRAFFSMPV